MSIVYVRMFSFFYGGLGWVFPLVESRQRTFCGTILDVLPVLPILWGSVLCIPPVLTVFPSTVSTANYFVMLLEVLSDTWHSSISSFCAALTACNFGNVSGFFSTLLCRIRRVLAGLRAHTAEKGSVLGFCTAAVETVSTGSVLVVSTLLQLLTVPNTLKIAYQVHQ